MSTHDHIYKYTLSDLMEAFEKAGMKVSRKWFYRQEAKGKLSLPRSTTHVFIPKWTNTAGGVRIMTARQVRDIVHAFLPGGSGEYHFQPAL